MSSVSEGTRETSERSNSSIFGAQLVFACKVLAEGLERFVPRDTFPPFGAGAGMQDAEPQDVTGQGGRGPLVNCCQNWRFDRFCLFFLAKLCF